MDTLKNIKFEHVIIISLLIILTIVLFIFKENEKIVNTVLATFTNVIVFSTSKLYEHKEKNNINEK